MTNYKKEWDESYGARQNFLFYPNEELVRFVSKYLRKQVGIAEFKNVASNVEKFLDVGCGIGRHVIYGKNMGYDVYGIDLASEAINYARDWADNIKISDSKKRLVEASVDSIPFPDNFFDVAVSHGVFDSMPFQIAKLGISEVSRVLKKNSFFYVDLISGDDSWHHSDYCGEEVVADVHEKNTVQSYFNYKKILELIDAKFSIVECNLIKRKQVDSGKYGSRYHIVLINNC